MTVDRGLIEAGQRAVEAGHADSVSAWVNAALEDKLGRDLKLARLAAAVADYEQEFGDITTDEMLGQQRADREQAVVVRGRREQKTRKGRSA